MVFNLLFFPKSKVSELSGSKLNIFSVHLLIISAIEVLSIISMIGVLKISFCRGTNFVLTLKILLFVKRCEAHD